MHGDLQIYIHLITQQKDTIILTLFKKMKELKESHSKINIELIDI